MLSALGRRPQAPGSQGLTTRPPARGPAEPAAPAAQCRPRTPGRAAGRRGRRSRRDKAGADPRFRAALRSTCPPSVPDDPDDGAHDHRTHGVDRVALGRNRDERSQGKQREGPGFEQVHERFMEVAYELGLLHWRKTAARRPLQGPWSGAEWSRPGRSTLRKRRGPQCADRCLSFV